MAVGIGRHTLSSSEVLKQFHQYIFPLDIINDLIQNKFGSLKCVTMHLNDRLIGLAIGAQRNDGGIQLISFYIIPSCRGKGHGSQLMASFISAVNGTDFKKIQANYKTFWPDNAAWEKIVRNNDWDITNSELHYVLIDRLFDLKREKSISNLTLPPNTHVRPLDAQKIAYLRNWIQQSSWSDEMPADVRPDKALIQTNTESSLLLLIDHDIAGWIIVHDLEPSIGQVSALHIRKKYGKQYRQLALRLIAEAIRRNQTLEKVYFGYRNENKYLRRLIQNRFKDYGTNYQKRRCQKILQ